MSPVQEFDNGVIYRGRGFYKNGWKFWYEECPVLRHTTKYVVIESKDYPGTPLKPGGKFSIPREALIQTGKAYHSRYGEYFYLEKPDQGFLFPSKDVMDSEDALISELKALGWEQYNLTDEQLQMYMTAHFRNTNIKNVIEGNLHKDFY
jgi:hypothetical protein